MRQRVSGVVWGRTGVQGGSEPTGKGSEAWELGYDWFRFFVFSVAAHIFSCLTVSTVVLSTFP